MTEKQPFPSRLMADPGNDAAYVAIPTACLFCAQELLPGDYRWCCHGCFFRLRNRTLGQFLEENAFSFLVSPVRNSTRAREVRG